jgi:hypothetical protein
MLAADVGAVDVLEPPAAADPDVDKAAQVSSGPWIDDVGSELSSLSSDYESNEVKPGSIEDVWLCAGCEWD